MEIEQNVFFKGRKIKNYWENFVVKKIPEKQLKITKKKVGNSVKMKLIDWHISGKGEKMFVSGSSDE